MIKPARIMAAVGCALLLSSCALLGDDPAPSTAATGPVEQPLLRVAALPSAELAPLSLAADAGYFREEGLDVNVTLVKDGQAATAGLIGGTYDVVYSSYVPLILAHANKAADLRIITDNSSAAERTAVLTVKKDSPVKTLTDLAGKTISVPAPKTLADLMVKSTLATHGVDTSKIKWAPIGFDSAPGALLRGEVQAAMLVEPYITATSGPETDVLVDLATGPLKDLPFTAYAATKAFTQAKPKTVAAFQRAMAKGADRANTDRPAVEPLVAKYTNVSPTTTQLMKLPRFNATLDPRRIQRVADLMTNFGVLPTRFDVAPMLQPAPPAR